MPGGTPEDWRIYVDFWLGMGYDCVPTEIAPRLPLPDGFWALGTGNSLTDYMPVANYIGVLEEGMNVH